MPLNAAISHASYLFGKSMSIWFAVWAVRYKAEWDYKLSPTAKTVRWAVVAIGYLLAVSLPTGFMRIITGFIGLGFLCWPNFAYHLTKLLVDWPTAQGRIVSTASSDDGVVVSYAFQVGNQTFGGDALVKSDGPTAKYSEGERVIVAYDPLNPDESRFLRPVAVDAR